MRLPNHKATAYITASVVAGGLAFVALIIGFLFFIGSMASAEELSASTGVQLPTPEERAMINLTNDYRVSHGLIDLTTNNQLMQSAQAKADDLCSAGNWSHTDSRGREFQGFIEDAGYDYALVGENLARHYVDEASAFEGLVKSPGHLENIVGQYREIGVGYSECGGENLTVVHYGVQQ